MATTRKSNIARKSVRTLIVGKVHPLDRVRVYSPGYGCRERLDITATVEVGSTTHETEIRLSPSGAEALAKSIINELPSDVTPQQLGMYGWVKETPPEEESTPQES